jgi:AraC-like DNA-binding protein
MHFTESGIRATSSRYFFTPSSFAELILFYPTRIGHYFCDTDYSFNGQSEIGLNPTHHLHYMLMQIIHGNMQLTLNGRSYEASAGEIVIFDCKEPHEYHARSENLEFYWLVFDGLTFRAMYDKILELHGEQNVFPSSNRRELQSLFKRLLSVGDGSAHISETAQSEIIYSILCCLFLTQKKADTPSAAVVENAMHFMDLHYMESITVEKIASASGFSASHLTRCFRAQTGYSPHEYLMLRRISAAKNLLISTDLTIHRIAFETGYQSDENFIRSFKKATGTSPSAFRRTPV